MTTSEKQRSHNTVMFDLSSVLNYSIQLTVETWDSSRPLHWFSQTDDSVLAEGRFLEAPGLPLFTLEDDSGRRVSDGIPDSVLKVTRLMPAMDFELAQACAASSAACELAESSPLLFILLVDYARGQSLTLDEFEELLALKRTSILEKADLPASKSLVKLVNRIELSPLLPWELKDVVKTLRCTEFIELLRHYPNLHLNHLRFLRRQRQPLWPGMLYLVDSQSSALDITWLCRMIRDTLTMAEGNVQRLRHVRSRDALQDLHDRLVGWFNNLGSEGKRKAQAAALEQRHGEYPAAPIPAIEGIEPLTSWLELLEEGVAMRHCVGSYDQRVADREVFIYRMIHPERLTISLAYQNNRWIVSEVRGSRNANPPTRAMDYIRRWVETP
ncbi:PcfJ domain-containing protein [Marinobacter sp. DY40_1A1]|uniref:PcfJ domain-containing protein n=1 Tax=Marinobacter sp. DY40_1A1 TaxID=2583229 RepID=UPI001906A246|nr:PcfJ domain-containing protein [Marinobacter sp. DY40_1A1]MBK1885613.1 PcfJ domain-containing protein [Marinobacter sp. DY40_1A1]